MVHALETLRGLLSPGGLTIDFHPSGEPPSIEVRARGLTTLAGWLNESDDAIEYAQAEAAIHEAADRGWFEMVRQWKFSFATHADTLEGLRRYLAKEWKDAVIDERTAMQIEDLMRTPHRDKETVVRKMVNLTLLRSVETGPATRPAREGL
jgi:hypothetical protein